MTDVTETGIYNSRYEIIRQVARGGMAEVYLARDLQLHRPVALKVLFRELSTDRAFVQRFRHEAQAAANLSHPHIVSVYDWGESEADNTYFIVMEYVDGDPLSKMIRTRGPLDPVRAAEIGADVASALAHAHTHGVIHRDVKPGNVLVTHEGSAKVTDFGIARGHNTDSSLTQTGAVMGTATYFSPEQAQGERVDARSDIYSLAVVLYEMVVGRPPFSGDNPIAIATKHVREVPPAPTALDGTIPPDFEAIVMKGMAKAPEERYQTASELQKDLSNFAVGRRVEAPAYDQSVTAFYEGAAATTIIAPQATRTRVVKPSGNGAATPPGGTRPDGDRSSGSRVAALVAAMVLLAVLLGLGSYALVQGLGGGSGSSFDVPNVVGMYLHRAEASLQSDGLKVSISYTSSSDKPGRVVNQNPPYPTPVTRGDTVTLSVSKGGQVPVPSVLNQSQSTATATLKSAGFQVQAKQAPLSCDQANQLGNGQGNIGNVIDEIPNGGSAPIGSTVTLKVSQGVAVPNVANQSATAASNMLGQCGLTLGTTNDQPSPAGQSIPSGFVISASPGVGSFVNPGSQVNLNVSTGTGVSVPNVVGDPLGDAETAIEQAGLVYTVTTVPASSTCQSGDVCAENPSAGTTVNSGSTVTLSEGQSSSSSTTSASSTTTTTPATGGGGTGGVSGGGPPTSKG